MDLDSFDQEDVNWGVVLATKGDDGKEWSVLMLSCRRRRQNRNRFGGR